jgi:hypothetical protein
MFQNETSSASRSKVLGSSGAYMASKTDGGAIFTIRHQNTKALFDYWNAVRNGKQAPRRTDIDPIAMKRWLASVFILQRLDRDHVIFRLAGTRLCSTFGREFREQNILAMFHGDCHRAVRSLLDEVVCGPYVGLAKVTAVTLDKREANGEMIFLPLADATGRIDRVLGCLNLTHGEKTLGHRKLVRQWIDQIQIIDADIDRAGTLPRYSRPDGFQPRLYLVKST